MTTRPDYFGCAVGLLVMLGGLALLGLTFKLAYDMFAIPPERAMGFDPKKPVDMNLAGQSFAGLIIRVLLLLTMALIGSLIANRGINLYLAGRRQLAHRHESES